MKIFIILGLVEVYGRFDADASDELVIENPINLTPHVEPCAMNVVHSVTFTLNALQITHYPDGPMGPYSAVSGRLTCMTNSTFSGYVFQFPQHEVCPESEEDIAQIVISAEKWCIPDAVLDAHDFLLGPFFTYTSAQIQNSLIIDDDTHGLFINPSPPTFPDIRLIPSSMDNMYIVREKRHGNGTTSSMLDPHTPLRSGIVFERLGDLFNRLLDAPDWTPKVSDDDEILQLGIWSQKGGLRQDSQVSHTLVTGKFRIPCPEDQSLETIMYLVEDICPYDESA